VNSILGKSCPFPREFESGVRFGRVGIDSRSPPLFARRISREDRPLQLQGDLDRSLEPGQVAPSGESRENSHGVRLQSAEFDEVDLLLPGEIVVREYRPRMCGERSLARLVLFGGSIALISVVLLCGCHGGAEKVSGLYEQEVLDGGSIATDGQLILFWQPGGGEAVESEMIESLRNIAQEFGFALELRDLSRGAPDSLTGTPTLVFQNHRGRSVYVGRLTTADRIRSFLRTVQRVPQTDSEMVREDIAVWSDGRAQIAVPLKITEVTGTVPIDFDQASFQRVAQQALVEGMDRFSHRERVSLRKTDRAVYFDLHPYLSSDGRLFLSGALYSQFHCHTPRWEIPREEYTAVLSEAEELFRRLGKRVQRELIAILSEEEGLDSYQSISKEVQSASWESLGLPLPPPPPESLVRGGDAATFPKSWRVSSAAMEGVSPVSFHFPPPLNHFFGEASGVSGEFHQVEDDRFEGRFSVSTATVTMGEPDLDYWIHGSQVLQVSKYPDASFEIVSGILIGAIEWGKPTPIGVQARFSMRGHELEVIATGSLLPRFDRLGEPELFLEGRFTIPLAFPFEIQGPDGPEESRDLLQIEVAVLLVPIQMEE